MTSNNETASRQMPWAGNIAKTMTSNGKQFIFTREMLTAVARHLSIKWLFVFHRFDPFVLLYDKSLNDWSLGEQWILFPEHLNVSRDEMLSATYSQFFFLWKNLLVSPVTSAKNILTDKIPAFLRAFKVVISMCTTAKRGTWVGLLVKPS